MPLRAPPPTSTHRRGSKARALAGTPAMIERGSAGVPMSDDRSEAHAVATADLLRRHRRLHLLVIGGMLLGGAIIGASALWLALSGALGWQVVPGVRNPAAFMFLATPLVVCWGVGGVAHLMLVRR